MNPEISVALVVTSDVLDEKEVTRLIGTQPSASWKKGEKSQFGVERRTGGWRLDLVSNLEVSEIELAIEEAVREVQKRMTLPGMIDSPSSAYKIRLLVRVGFSDSTPSLNLKAAAIANLAQLGIDLEIDFNHYSG
jgi:hypothetical protein